METRKIVPVKLTDGMIIHVEDVAGLPAEEDIAHRVPSFEGFTQALQQIAARIRGSIEGLQPNRATVEFGLDVGLEAGQLTAMIVKGTGTAHVTVTLEW